MSTSASAPWLSGFSSLYLPLAPFIPGVLASLPLGVLASLPRSPRPPGTCPQGLSLHICSPHLWKHVAQDGCGNHSSIICSARPLLAQNHDAVPPAPSRVQPPSLLHGPPYHASPVHYVLTLLFPLVFFVSYLNANAMCQTLVNFVCTYIFSGSRTMPAMQKTLKKISVESVDE